MSQLRGKHICKCILYRVICSISISQGYSAVNAESIIKADKSKSSDRQRRTKTPNKSKHSRSTRF